MCWIHRPSDKLWGDLADDPSRSAPALLSKSPRVMGQCGWSWGAIIGSTAPVSELSSVESAATGGTTGETVLLWGANTVCRRRGGGASRRGATKRTNVMTEAEYWTLRILLHVTSFGLGCSPGFKLCVVIDRRQCAFWRMPWRWHGLGVTGSCGAHCSWWGATRNLS